MRIVFHNPHTDQWFKRPLNYLVTRTNSVDKYSFIFNYIYKREKIIYVYLDKSNCLVYGSIISILRKNIPPRIEFYLWVLTNRLNPFKFRIIKNIENLKKNDILLSFIISHFTNLSGKFNTSRKYLTACFSKTKAYKVVHLSHYGYNASIGSENTKKAEINLFVAENNLSKNSPFFKHFFDWYKKDVYMLPFVPKERFKNIKKFNERKNKAIATGTLTLPLIDNDFTGFYGNGILQPMRFKIYKNKEKILSCIDSYIANIEENKVNHNITSNTFFLSKLINTIYSRFSLKQKKYFSFNIVQKYNEYKMFIVPEEVIGLPGIGFVEGMLCGAAFIGIEDPMYKDIGLIAGINYIGYDGTLGDLVNKIRFYQQNNEKLEKIANAGYLFVQSNFNKENVMKKFLKYLENEITKR